MRVRVDPTHDIMQAEAGKAVRVNEGDVDGFLCWVDLAKLDASPFYRPEQFIHARYACDLELFDDGRLVVHKERAFPTAEKARAWFRYVAWCLVNMRPGDFVPAGNAWELS